MQTPKRCVSEIHYQNLFEAGNQLNAGVFSQSASSNHALLFPKSALVIKKKMPSVSANQRSVILPRMWGFVIMQTRVATQDINFVLISSYQALRLHRCLPPNLYQVGNIKYLYLIAFALIPMF